MDSKSVEMKKNRIDKNERTSDDSGMVRYDDFRTLTQKIIDKSKIQKIKQSTGKEAAYSCF